MADAPHLIPDPGFDLDGELDVVADLADEASSFWVSRVRAKELLHGAVRVGAEPGGWSRPWRFYSEQVHALRSAQAWHPGKYWNMSRCCAGITIEFETDAQRIALECQVDRESATTRNVLSAIDGPDPADRLPHDGFSCDVIDTGIVARSKVGKGAAHAARKRTPAREAHLGPVLSGPASEEDDVLPGAELVVFDLAPEQMPPLPGLGSTRRVCIHLPALRGCVVHDLLCDGTFIHPVAERPVLLLLGDSVAQGFVAGDPALSWPSVVARRLRCELVNQSVGGQVFQTDSLVGLGRLPKPRHVVVALGENYRYESCNSTMVRHEIHAYLNYLETIWPDAEVRVLSPTWHDEEAWPTNPKSCFPSVPKILADETMRHDGWSFVDGHEVMEHSPELLADGCDHPNREGHAQIAARMASELSD
ncbi:MAG: SGNH/GDSL hydrolase family protein [Atopobiaceae bacterium]|jgi:hypothetical protein|nr:SGNH/GDSL hydrolase family protein [Atopobiaceae bacterium]